MTVLCSVETEATTVKILPSEELLLIAEVPGTITVSVAMIVKICSWGDRLMISGLAGSWYLEVPISALVVGRTTVSVATTVMVTCLVAALHSSDCVEMLTVWTGEGLGVMLYSSELAEAFAVMKSKTARNEGVANCIVVLVLLLFGKRVCKANLGRGIIDRPQRKFIQDKELHDSNMGEMYGFVLHERS